MEKTYAENPGDIANYFRKKENNRSSFHVKSAFSRETGYEKDGKPLAIFDHFSRIVVTIIENGKFVEANIQYEKLPEMLDRGDYALKCCFDREMTPVVVQAENASPAYTVVIANGKLKGKTPAQVMQEPDGGKKLNDQYKWLQDNLSKYPKNQIQMDAIADAAKLYKEGKLAKPEKAAISSTFNILEAEPLPLTRKKDKKTGMCPVREISIEADFTKDSPFLVTIVNYDAPVKEEINVQKTNMKNERRSSFRLTVKEFSAFLRHIKNAERLFINANSSVLYKEYQEAEKNNRENARKKKDSEDPAA